jgi:hypothetical protein
MRIKKKEILFGIVLGVVVILVVAYPRTMDRRNASPGSVNVQSVHQFQGSNNLALNPQPQPYYEVITETIEGEVERGTFEDAISHLSALTEEHEGYVRSLSMTYTQDAWSGYMVCKLPPANVTSFTFGARAIIDANGTVTYINVSMENVNASELWPGQELSTINVNLKEKKLSDPGLAASFGPIGNVLSSSMFIIAEGLIIGVPLCLVSLAVVLLVTRGILPLWKKGLQRTRQPMVKQPQ